MKTTDFARGMAVILLILVFVLAFVIVVTYGMGEELPTYTIYILSGIAVIALGFGTAIIVLCRIADDLRRYVGDPPDETEAIMSELAKKE